MTSGIVHVLVNCTKIYGQRLFVLEEVMGNKDQICLSRDTIFLTAAVFTAISFSRYNDFRKETSVAYISLKSDRPELKARNSDLSQLKKPQDSEMVMFIS